MSVPLQQSMSPYAGLFGSPPRASTSDFQAQKRLKLHLWSPTQPKKGLLLLVHGFGEHLERYDHVAHFFTQQGYEVRGSDLVAHGLSEGFDGSYGRLDLQELTSNWQQYVFEEILPLPGAPEIKSIKVELVIDIMYDIYIYISVFTCKWMSSIWQLDVFKWPCHAQAAPVDGGRVHFQW